MTALLIALALWGMALRPAPALPSVTWRELCAYAEQTRWHSAPWF